MRRTFSPLLSVAALLGLLALGATSAARAADDDARAIVVKAIKAHGGEEALTKFKAGRAKTKGKIDIAGVGEVEFTQDVVSMLPDKLKDTMEMQIAGMTITVVTLVNGDKISIEAAGKEVPINDAIKKALKDALHMSKVARLVPLVKDKNIELSLLGEADVEGKKTRGVLVKAKGEKEISLYFDKETGMMTKVEHRTIQPGAEKEITEERIVLEYNKPEKGSIATPKKVLVKHDGKKFLEAEVTEAKALEKIDDSEFKK